MMLLRDNLPYKSCNSQTHKFQIFKLSCTRNYTGVGMGNVYLCPIKSFKKSYKTIAKGTFLKKQFNLE